MPSVDEVARSAKSSLRSSISITHNLTLNSTAPRDFILHRMNEVLRAAVDNNFDTPSMDAVGALYAAIGEAQPHMVADAHELALVNLSRTFAVVLEEAIKMKGKPTGSSGNNNSTSGTSGGDWSNTAQSSGIESWKASSGSYGKPPVSNLSAGAAQPLKGFGPQLSKTTTASGAAKTAPAPLSADEIARRKKREEQKDYSPEAIEGRIRVFKIPIVLTEMQLRTHFEQIGEIFDISYPIEQGKHKGFALMKFKDNATADEVCARLNGSKLLGAELSVERATYWFKRNKPPVRTGKANAGSGSGTVAGPGSGKPASDGGQTGHASRLTSVSSEVVDDEEEDSSDEGSDPGIC